MKNKYVYIAGFAIIALMIIATLAFVTGEFGGSDDAGSEDISEMNPDYETWTDGIWGSYELPGETESFLFALQAAIGAVIIGYFIGYMRMKNKYEKKNSENIE